MKILIAISSKEYKYGVNLVGLGMKVASACKVPPTTIVDVGEKINEFGSKDVNMSEPVN